MPQEKAKWERHKDATRCLLQILEATPNKTAVVWPLTSHLTNYPKQARHAGHNW